MGIKMTPELQAAIDRGLLNVEKHTPLLEQLEHWCAIAGIQPADITRVLYEWVSPDEKDWVIYREKLIAEGTYGLLLVGPFARPDQPDVSQRMIAMTAAMLRIYEDARIRRAADAVDADASHPAVLLVPDSSADLPVFVRRDFGTLVQDRAMLRLPTVLHVPDLASIAALFNNGAGDLLHHAYRHVSV